MRVPLSLRAQCLCTGRSSAGAVIVMLREDPERKRPSRPDRYPLQVLAPPTYMVGGVLLFKAGRCLRQQATWSLPIRTVSSYKWRTSVTLMPVSRGYCRSGTAGTSLSAHGNTNRQGVPSGSTALDVSVLRDGVSVSQAQGVINWHT